MSSCFSKCLLFSVVFGVNAASATTLTLVTTVKEVTAIGRPGVDYGGVQIAVVDPITGTSCAAADLAKGFYNSSGQSVGSLVYVQVLQNQALSAMAQGLQVRVTFDSAACVSGYGVNIMSLTVIGGTGS